VRSGNQPPPRLEPASKNTNKNSDLLAGSPASRSRATPNIVQGIVTGIGCRIFR
jgi:hypothetical protein